MVPTNKKSTDSGALFSNCQVYRLFWVANDYERFIYSFL
jgi:hypothetical protein